MVGRGRRGAGTGRLRRWGSWDRQDDAGHRALAAPADGADRLRPVRCAAHPVRPRPVLEVATALGLDAPDDRDALLGCLLADLRGRAATLLVVEDAHWADDATIELLAMLGRRAVDLPLLLVVTYREDEVGAEHPLRLVLGDLVTASATAWIGLQPLSLDGGDGAGRAAGARRRRALRRTGGNPFYVTEALAAPTRTVPTTSGSPCWPEPRGSTAEPVPCSTRWPIVPGTGRAWLVEALVRRRPPARRRVRRARHARRRGRHLRVPPRAGPPRGGARDRRDGPARAPPRAPSPRCTRPARRRSRPASPTTPRGPATTPRSPGRRGRCHLAVDATAHREAVRHGERALAVGHAPDPDERRRAAGQARARRWPTRRPRRRGDAPRRRTPSTTGASPATTAARRTRSAALGTCCAAVGADRARRVAAERAAHPARATPARPGAGGWPTCA